MEKVTSGQENRGDAYRVVLAVSGTVGFAIMGDSLMYGILPLASSELGLLPLQVGILLSANRLIRLFSNTWLSALFIHFDPYRIFVISAILGVLTTVMYGLAWGFMVLLFARLAWGVSWSGLRQGSYQAIWAGAGSSAGRLMGLTWGIVRGGSAISVLVGGFLFDYFGYRPTVGVIAALSALAIPIALQLSWPANAAGSSLKTGDHSHSAYKAPRHSGRRGLLAGWQEAFASRLLRAVLAAGFLKLLQNSVLIATVSLFLAQQFGEQRTEIWFGIGVGALAGLVLATRWFSDLVMGPIWGGMSDRVGHVRLALILMISVCAGLALMLSTSGGLMLLALLLVLVTSTGVHITVDVYANQIARITSQPELFVGAYTTAADIGSAMGPLLAFSLVTAVGFAPIYASVALLVLLSLAHLMVIDLDSS